MRKFVFVLIGALLLSACVSAGPATTEDSTTAQPTTPPDATAEPPATATPAPTATPEPTEDSPAGWTNVTAVTTYSDDYGSLIVLGMLENVSDNQLEFVQIALILLDGNGEEITRVSAQVTNIAPGQRMPFKRVINEEPQGWETIETDVWDAEIVENLTTALEPVNVTADPDPNTSYIYTVKGEIRNTGEQMIESLLILVAYYDDAGELVAVSGSGHPFIEMGAGETFEIESGTNTSGGEISDYEIFAVGEIAGEE